MFDEIFSFWCLNYLLNLIFVLKHPDIFMGRDDRNGFYYCLMNGLRKEQGTIEVSLNFPGILAAPFINILPAARELFDQ